MFRPDERPASRTGRDRDLLPRDSRPGPYESPYEISRGYPSGEAGGRPSRSSTNDVRQLRTVG